MKETNECVFGSNLHIRSPTANSSLEKEPRSSWLILAPSIPSSVHSSSPFVHCCLADGDDGGDLGDEEEDGGDLGEDTGSC